MKALRVTWSFGSCTSFLPPADTTIRSTVNRHERAAQDQNKRCMTNLADPDSDKTSLADADYDNTGLADAYSDNTGLVDADSDNTGLADADSDDISLVDTDSDNASLAYPDSDNTSLADVDSITCATTMHRCCCQSRNLHV